MELITERSRIKGVADAWDAQYGPALREPDLMVKMAELVTTELQAIREALRT